MSIGFLGCHPITHSYSIPHGCQHMLPNRGCHCQKLEELDKWVKTSDS